MDPVLPRANSQPIAQNGQFTREWSDYLRAILPMLLEVVDAESSDAEQIASILARLDALEAETDATINGLASVEVFGSLESGLVQIQLQGDADAPGARYVYGTDADGVKGWTPVLVETLTGSTYSTLQHFVNTMHSPGIITGGDLSQLDADTVRVSAGTGMVRVVDDDVSSLVFFDFPQQDFDIPADQDTRFYAVTYNAGSPTCVESLIFDWDKDTEIPLGSAVRFNGTMVVTPNKYRTGDPITNIIQRFDANLPASRDNSIGGLALGEIGTRNVTLSGGVIWSRLSDFTVPAKDSSVDSMVSAYFNGTGLTFTSGITQWDNQNYNDIGTGTLVAIGNNKYANIWFFISIDGTQYGFAYGTGDYNSVGDAANEGVPSYLTQDFFNQSLLLGRFIFQESAATASLIESAFATLFTTQAINTHNDLGGLQGGVVGEYYHLTAAEHAGLLPWAVEDPADYALITQTITNGDTTHSPSGDAVFDALAGKDDAGSAAAALIAAMDFTSDEIDAITPESIGMASGFDNVASNRVADLDAMLGGLPCFFSALSSATGNPGAQSGSGVFIPLTATLAIQIFANVTGVDANRRVFYRAANITWGPWIEIAYRFWNATSAASGAITPNVETNDAVIRTAISAGITINNPTGTKQNGRPLTIRLRDNGTARSVTWGSEYRSMTATLPTTTVANKTLYCQFLVNADETTLDLMNVQQQP